MRRWAAILVMMSLAFTALPMAASALEVPGTILVYTGGGALNEGYSSFGTATQKTVVTSSTLEGLAVHDCVVLPMNTSFSETELTSLQSYVSGGGRLFALAEHSGFPNSINAMNAVAGAVGSGMSVSPAAFGAGGAVTDAINTSSPFTAGVLEISYAATSAVIAGDAQWLVATPGEGSTRFMGAEQIGSGLFVLSGDTNVFSDGGFFGSNNGILAANLCPAQEPEADVDLSVTKDAEQANVTAGGDAAFTVAVTNNSETAATGVTVEDQASFSPEGFVGIQSASGDDWACGSEGGFASCSYLVDLGPGATTTELVVIVQAPGSPGTITNTATVSGDQPDPVGPNSASAQVTVQAANSGSVETFLETSDQNQTLATQGGQAGWNSTMTVPAGSPAGVYRLTEIPDPVQLQGSKGAVTYLAPEGAEVFVQMTCLASQCPKRRLLDLVVLVIKTDDDGRQHLLPPCHLVIRVGRRNIIIDRPAPCVVSVTRANAANAPLIWTIKVKGGPDPGARGR